MDFSEKKEGEDVKGKDVSRCMQPAKCQLITDIFPNWSHEHYKLHIIFFHREVEKNELGALSAILG